MLISHNREKLINSIIFFSKNTAHCHKAKLFKLLYFLDFEHFKATGRSVTGLSYFAWPMGPVPTSLYAELDSPSPDLAQAVSITIESNSFGKLLIRPTEEFNASIFSKREIKLLNQLSKEYKASLAEDMIEATHLENAPWDRVFNKEGNPQAAIPYEYALLTGEKAEMLAYIQERSDFIKATTH